MTDAFDKLDNPVWQALTTRQAYLAAGRGLARRLPADISPLCGMRDQSTQAWHDLAELLLPNEVAVLFLAQLPDLPAHWRKIRHEPIVQMVLSDRALVDLALHGADPTLLARIRTLDASDIPAMLELTTLTEPGPFLARTHELGHYLGVHNSSPAGAPRRLIAMAGERLNLPGFTEVSAVCTHPDARGRGFARLLVASVARNILDRGDIPCLTAYATNSSAIRVYESVGFTLRKTMIVVIAAPSQRGR